MTSHEKSVDLGRMRNELAHLAERMSELMVEQSSTQRRRDQIAVALYRAGMDLEEIADLAHLTPIDVRRLAQQETDRPARRGSESSHDGRSRPIRF